MAIFLFVIEPNAPNSASSGYKHKHVDVYLWVLQSVNS